MIYIHIPFCRRKCSYCGFYSSAGRHDTEGYIAALCHEMADRKDFFGDTFHPVTTLYIGGGTPSLLPIDALSRIFDGLERHFDLSQIQEVTLECNPDDLTDEYLESLARLRLINRISIGVQSFDDKLLHLLNRRHNGATARTAIARCMTHGFNNISIDLIYNLPTQDRARWAWELASLAQLNAVLPHPVAHLSCYALTVEPGTLLERQIAARRTESPDEETAVEQYEMLQQWTQQSGYQQYEVSNYCREGAQALHNSRYWRRVPYLGLGAAAHSFDGLHRRWNIADTEAYIKKVTDSTDNRPYTGYYEEETLTQADAYNEYLMTALRTTEGIDKQCIDAPFAEPLETAMRQLESQGLITVTDTHYRPTAAGLLQADGIACRLFASKQT